MVEENNLWYNSFPSPYFIASEQKFDILCFLAENIAQY